MKEMTEIEKATMALRGMLLDPSLMEDRRDALKLAIKIMQPIYGLSTIQWERLGCTFDLPGDMSPEEADRAIQHKAPMEIVHLLAPNMLVEKMYDFPTDTIHIKATLFVGKRDESS